MESPLALQERVENASQPSIGLSLWAEPQGNAIASHDGMPEMDDLEAVISDLVLTSRWRLVRTV